MNISTKNTFMAVLIGLCVFRIIAGLIYPIVPDEAYYALWSVSPQLSYIDHPFVVSLWGSLGHVFNYHFCRLLSPIAGLISAVAIYRSSVFIFGKGEQATFKKAAAVTLIWSFIPGNSVVFTTLTPDAPLLFFLSLTLWSFCSLLEHMEQGAALDKAVIFGLLSGVACEAKYSALLFVVPLFAFLLFYVKGETRRKVKIIVTSLGCFLLMMLPSIAWNFKHEWIGYFKQVRRFQVWDASKGGKYLLELIGGQLFWATPPVLVAMIYAAWKCRREAMLLFFVMVPGLILFLTHISFERVQANWLCFLYIPLSIFCFVLPNIWQKIAIVSAVIGSILLYVQALLHPIPMTAHIDPSLRLSAGWKGMATALAERYPEENIITSDYGLGSVLSIYIPDGRKVYGLDYRWPWLKGAKLTEELDGIVVRPLRDDADPDNDMICRYRDDRIESEEDDQTEAVRCYEIVPVEEQTAYEIPKV